MDLMGYIYDVALDPPTPRCKGERTNLPTIHGGEFDGDEFHGIESATNHYWKRKVKIYLFSD